VLNEDQVQKVRMTLMSSGWNEVMRPIAARRAQEVIKALVLSPGERTGEFKEKPDDALRAIIQESEWWLTVWENEVKMFDINRRMDELRRQDGAGQEPSPLPTAANP